MTNLSDLFPSGDQPRQFRPPTFGQVINHNGRIYRIGNKIGDGAFGDVFECTDEWANGLVAKVLRPLNRTYEEVRAEWLRELNALAQFRHPNVTFVYDAIEHEDTFYLILERCEFTLNTLMTMPGYDGRQWLPYVAGDVLQAVEFIHASGYVHKDLHAGNVFVSWVRDKMVPQKQPVWQFKVGDLGISRLESDIDFLGTVLAQWMLPPEYLNPGEFGVVARTTDIYHVGLLLLRMLSPDALAFTAEDIVSGRPRQLAEQLDSPFSEAIAKALRRHAADRTQSAIQLWRDILAASN